MSPDREAINRRLDIARESIVTDHWADNYWLDVRTLLAEIERLQSMAMGAERLREEIRCLKEPKQEGA